METPDDCAVRLSKQGHNILVTGQCGTGKSHLLRSMVCALRQNGKKVDVTSTTGISSLQLGAGAVTVHHWAGIGDGRYSAEFPAGNFPTDDHFSESRERILKADCLAIDEIGMASQKIFDMLELVCRITRRTNRLFGGLQVIATGDFKQLPPVANYRYGDPGNYCFESDVFKKVFPHHIELKQVHRQSEPDLIKAVNELCNGDPSPETEQFLRSLNRDIPSGTQGITTLVGTNFDADFINELCLAELPGQEITFKAEDTGNCHLLRDCAAKKTLILKVGAPVVVIRNLPGLFNGMLGVVHSISATEPVVNIDGKLHSIHRIDFDVYDPVKNQTLAARKQFPLKLAFAMTVHRSQGMTLKKLEINCFSIFAPGQFGVAVGRVCSSENLKIISYNSSAARLHHPEKVYDFYKEESVEPKEDLGCCVDLFHEENANDSEDDGDDNDEDSDSGQKSPAVLDEVLPATDDVCPWSLDDFINKNLSATFMPQSVSDTFTTAAKNHSNFLYSVLANVKMPKDIDGFTTFYQSINSFLTSAQHLSSLDPIGVSPKPQKFSSKLMFWLIDQQLEERSNEIVNRQANNPKPSPQEPSSAEKAKIRYLAGACVQKITTRLKSSVYSKLRAKSKNVTLQRQRSYEQHQLLKTLRISEEESKRTSCMPETLSEIDYKQGPSRGLCIVNDDVFLFFMRLHRVVQQNLTDNDFHMFLEIIHTHVRNIVFSDESLFHQWIILFDACTESDEADRENFDDMLYELFKLVVDYFVRISLSERLTFFKESIPKQKKQALRSKVLALSQRSTNRKKL